MQIHPYLDFGGRCEEALTFYTSAVGANVEMLMRFKDMPEPHEPGVIPPGAEEKVMHVTFRIGESTVMATDGQCQGTGDISGISLSIQMSDIVEAERIFTALANGGEVHMPFAETFWAPRFGIVADKFGVPWMVNVATAP